MKIGDRVQSRYDLKGEGDITLVHCGDRGVIRNIVGYENKAFVRFDGRVLGWWVLLDCLQIVSPLIQLAECAE